MRRLALTAGGLVVVALAIAGLAARDGDAPAALPAPAGRLPLLGFVGQDDASRQLARFDPRTLRPLAGRLRLDGHDGGWSLSPGGATLALGNGDGCAGIVATLRLVDPVRLRTLGDVRLPVAGSVDATAWTDATHLLAVVAEADCGGVAPRTLVAGVDAARRRVVSRTPLPGDVLATARAPGGLVFLLGPHGRIGTPRLAVVGAGGALRTVALAQLRAGQTTPGAGRYITGVDQPGLAIAGRRAFVVPAGDRLAEVDLASLRVAYHDLTERTTWWSRLLGWLDPPALAKGSNGPLRQALWLGGGRLAVTGVDTSARAAADGRPEAMRQTAAGLRLVDVRDWTYRTLDPRVSSLQLAGGLLFAEGESTAYAGTRSTETAAGLTVYDRDGRRRYHAFGRADVTSAVAIGRVGYAEEMDRRGRDRTLAFDLATGAPRGRMSTQLWQLLIGNAAQ